MSIQAVAWVLDHSESKGYARLVLISLANHYNGKTGQCNPGQRAIAREAGISPGSVPPQIRALVELGELEVAEEGGPRKTARYSLPFMGAQELSAERSGAERSARPKAERSARRRAEQNRKEPERTSTEPPTTPPTDELPALRWAKRWAELRQVPFTPTVRRSWSTQVQEFLSAGGEPSDALLERACREGIREPKAWPYVATPDASKGARANAWMEDR